MEKKVFEIGKRYFMTSLCDHDCKWIFEVVARTAATVTVKQVREDGTLHNAFTKLRIDGRYFEQYGEETVKPLGSYSMCPVLNARRAA